jgi:beta-lactamase regulating signal transducer with metallopeptidase domain
MNLLLQNSFQATLLAGAVWTVIGLAGNWLSPRIRYGLWLLVIARLIIPGSLTDPWSYARPSWWTWQNAEVERPVESTKTNAHAKTHVTGNRPRLEMGSLPLARSHPDTSTQANLDEAVFYSSPDGPTPVTPGTGLDPVTPLGLPIHPSSTPSVVEPAPPTLPAGPTVGGQPAPPTLPKPNLNGSGSAPKPPEIQGAAFPWPSLLTGAWLIGALLMLLRAIGIERNWRRRLKIHTQPAPAEAQILLRQCCRSMGMNHDILLVETPLVPAPAAHGIRQPQILLPTKMWAKLSTAEQEFILLHELAHIRHFDAVSNWLLLILRALHWFNPALWLAFARLRDEREMLRDREALRARPHTAATDYAATILKLVPRENPQPTGSPILNQHQSLSALVLDRKATSKRIAMIVRNRPFRNSHLAFGVALLSLLGWAGLTAAQNSPTQDPYIIPGSATFTPATAQSAAQVTRQQTEPAWQTRIRQSLQTQVSWKSDELNEVVEHLNETTPINIRMSEDVEGEDFPVFEIDSEIPLQTALDLICWQNSIRWTIVPEGIYLCWRDEFPEPTDLRFYNVDSLFGERPNTDALEQFQELLYEVAGPVNAWDSEGSAIRSWNGQLLIQQTDSMHRDIVELCNLLSQLGPNQPPEIDPKLQKALNQNITIQAERRLSPAELARILSQAIGVPVVNQIDLDEEFKATTEPILLKDFLQSLSLQYDLSVDLFRGAILIGHDLPLELRCYAVSELVQPSQRELEELEQQSVEEDVPIEELIPELRRWKMEELSDVMSEVLGGQNWDTDGAGIWFFHDRLVIKQSHAMHQAIYSFLETAKVAITGN